MNPKLTDIPPYLRRYARNTKPLKERAREETLEAVLGFAIFIALIVMLLYIGTTIHEYMQHVHVATYSEVLVNGKVLALNEFCNAEHLSCP